MFWDVPWQLILTIEVGQLLYHRFGRKWPNNITEYDTGNTVSGCLNLTPNLQ
jgi:hypothetical protein